MATMYSVVVQTAKSNGNDHMDHLRRSSSASSTAGLQPMAGNEPTRSRSTILQNSKSSAPSFKDLVTEYYGPGQRLREIYLSSREGERFPVPITLAVQLSAKLREFVDTLMKETATRGRSESFGNSRRTLEVPCSTDVLRTLVEFVSAKLEFDLKLSEEGTRITEEQKREHWTDFMYARVAWRMDLDDFADDILKVADFLAMKSLYDLMKCCFRLRL